MADETEVKTVSTKSKKNAEPVQPAQPTQQELHFQNSVTSLRSAISHMTVAVISLQNAGAAPTANAIKEIIGDLTVTNALIDLKLRK